MDEALAAFDREWKAGNRERAKQMARDYVEGHRDELTPHLEGKSIHELVGMVSAYRGMGREGDRIIVDMWLLAEHPPQHVTGVIRMGAAAVIEAAEAILRGER